MTELRGGLNLHSHLEGSVRPATAAEIGQRSGVPEPPGGWASALEVRGIGTLTTYLGHVALAYPLFSTPDNITRIVREAIEDAAADGTRFLELRFGPMTHTVHGMALDDVVAAACVGVEDAVHSAAGAHAGLVVCALRQDDVATNVEVARTAARFAGRGVVGFDIAGDELLYPDLRPLREPFAIARAAGLGLTAHAAEAGPASAVRDAFELLGVRRIGHGLRAATDPELLRWAADEGICFEVCPTCNVLTGGATSYAEHPVRAFVDAGCEVVVGDDDPITTGSRLAAELGLLMTAVGLTRADVEQITRTSVERVFCDESVRESLRVASGSGLGS